MIFLLKFPYQNLRYYSHLCLVLSYVYLNFVISAINFSTIPESLYTPIYSSLHINTYLLRSNDSKFNHNKLLTQRTLPTFTPHYSKKYNTKYIPIFKLRSMFQFWYLIISVHVMPVFFSYLCERCNYCLFFVLCFFRRVWIVLVFVYWLTVPMWYFIIVFF